MFQMPGYQEYITTYNDERIATNPERIKRRSVYHRMMDIWGEVTRAQKAWVKWDATGEEKDKQALERQLDLIDRLCYLIYNDENASVGMKRSLRAAEWELHDFFFMDNRFHNTPETVTRWFDQWGRHHVPMSLT